MGRQFIWFLPQSVKACLVLIFNRAAGGIRREVMKCCRNEQGAFSLSSHNIWLNRRAHPGLAGHTVHKIHIEANMSWVPTTYVFKWPNCYFWNFIQLHIKKKCRPLTDVTESQGSTCKDACMDLKGPMDLFQSLLTSLECRSFLRVFT